MRTGVVGMILMTVVTAIQIMMMTAKHDSTNHASSQNTKRGCHNSSGSHHHCPNVTVTIKITTTHMRLTCDY